MQHSRMFQRVGGVCAIAVAVTSVLYALVLYQAAGGGLDLDALAATAETARAFAVLPKWLLFAMGLLSTVAIWGLYGQIHDTAPAWALWGTSLGFFGAVLMTIHGLWDAARIPALATTYRTGSPAHQAAIEAFSHVPSPMDPHGVGSLLFMGLFVLVAGILILYGRSLPRLAGYAGVLSGVLMISGFVLGVADMSMLRAWLLGPSFALFGPVFWAAAGWHLARL